MTNPHSKNKNDEKSQKEHLIFQRTPELALKSISVEYNDLV